MISMPSAVVNPTSSAGKEKILFKAVEAARAALEDVANPEEVGEHAGVVVEAERLLTHAFACLKAGYRGWFWTVTVSRIPRSSRVTVNEVALRPGPDALLAPEWVPWSDRVEPSDVSPTDRLPYNADDSRLEPGFEQTGEDADQIDPFEMGLGRPRVLSKEGRDAAFTRWYKGDSGPDNPGTRQAQANCSTCGFLMPMGGSARLLFGVCANEWSPFDGKVVSFDHGCGAHSETDVSAEDQERMWDPAEPVVDEADMELAAGVRS